MNGFEFSKILGALVLAVVVAALSGFSAEKLTEVAQPEKKAYLVNLGISTAHAAPAAASPEAASTQAPATAAPTGPGAIETLLADAKPEDGQKIARACQACHDFSKGGPNKVGPNLWGIVMNKHAHAEGFNYSPAMKALHDKSWTYEELNKFIYAPRDHVPGTKMAFAGIKSDKDRAAVIAWLRTLSDSPVALPAKK